MASPFAAAGCALAALILWTLVGAAVGYRVLPRPLIWPLAPSLGFAVHSAAALPILLTVGLTRTTVLVVTGLSLLASLIAVWRRPGGARHAAGNTVPIAAYAFAALLALAPATAVSPFWSDGGVLLASPIFDHAKVAMIDGMTRLGLPPANPFFGEAGAPGRLAYYYLWHFSAAEIAAASGASGWEADIALTWFTAFSSLSLMAGLAAWLSGRAAAAYWALLFAATASLRHVLTVLFGDKALEGLLAYPSGFGGWLFQSAWVPQHLAAASCVVIAVLLIARLPIQGGWPVLATLVLVIVAGFESSTWIGGIAFPIAMLIAGPIVLWQTEPGRRTRLCLAIAAVAVLSIALAIPFLRDQLTAVGARGGSPLGIRHQEVFGTAIDLPLRRVLDLPAYWLVFLVVEFPAFYLAGLAALARHLARPPRDAETQRPAAAPAHVPAKWTPVRRQGHAPTRESRARPDSAGTGRALAALTGACLAVAWLGISTLGDNNDLGLRAALPAAFVLIAFAAAGLSSWIAERRRIAAAATIAALALGLPEAAAIVVNTTVGRSHGDAATFAETPRMWAAVRRHAGPAERVANNPLFLRRLTPWPVNLSWALLSDRSSCYAGRELALPFAPLASWRREDIDAQFIRVFAGTGTAADVDDLALRYGCAVAVVSVEDGAWRRDPFAASAHYRLVEELPGRWRIYRRIEPVRSRQTS